MKTITLDFVGFWLDSPQSSELERSGVYCVYACKYSDETDRVTLCKLLYIGESNDVLSRLQGHDRHDDWMRQLQAGETLCFSFAPVSAEDRERAEAALIFKCQPPLNEEHTTTFAYNDTEIITSGRRGTLPQKFLVQKNERK